MQVLGGREQVKAYVNFCRFRDLGPEAEWVDGTGLPKTMRELAMAHRIRWPHQTCSNKAGHADRVRQRFAHLLYVNRIEGEAPNRTLVLHAAWPGRRVLQRETWGLVRPASSVKHRTKTVEERGGMGPSTYARFAEITPGRAITQQG